jgi:uncharacterized protein
VEEIVDDIHAITPATEFLEATGAFIKLSREPAHAGPVSWRARVLAGGCPSVVGLDRRMQIRRMRALLLALMVSVAAHARDSAPSSAEQLARRVLPPDKYAALVDQMSMQALNGLQRQGKQPSADEAQRFHAAIKEALPYEDMIRISARSYAAHLTDGELADVLAFYKTPAGVKFTRELPAILGDSTRETSQLMKSRMPALLEKYGIGAKQAPAGSGESAPPK